MLTDETMPVAPPAAPPKYQVLMELGRGGMGVAHLAVSRGPQGFTKLVVLKMMRKQLIGDAESHRMFLQEARISARLTHPNVVHVYEVIEYDYAPTLVMEYLEGQTLWALLRGREKLPLHLHLHILAKVLSGLHAAHELRDYDGSRPLNLIHRDVSPHNVSILFDGQVKVLDFGIAKASTSEVETRAGELKGKIRYMPPEQLIRENQDRRVDIFAVGVMLWEAITGKRFWGDVAESDVISDLLARKLPPVPPASADTPPQLRFICASALAADPECRYGTAGEFQRDLEDYLLSYPERASAEEELGAFLSRNFDEERRQARKVIEAHMSAIEAVPEPTPSVTRPGAASAIATASRTGTARPAPSLSESDDTRVLTPHRASLPAPAATKEPPTLTAMPAAAPRSPPILIVAVVVSAIVALAMTGLYVAGKNASAAATGREAGARPPLVAACAPGFKACGGACVSIARPDQGCGGESCYSCSVANATPRCNQANRCDIAVCYQDFDDCDGDASNGCETNLRTDPDNCRGCGRRCPNLAHAQRGCGDACTIWRCDEGFSDCNGVVSDGCEAAVSDDPTNCGRCHHACAAGQKCRRGVCG
jgi:serine/threonine-protein kinase